MKKNTILSLGLIATAVTTSSHAAIIMATNFDAATVSGSTMSAITWTTTDPNGAQVTGGAVAVTDIASFATDGGNPGQFAPDQNLHTGAGSWTGSFSLTVAAGYTADLTDITFDFDSRSSSGALQNATNIREILYDLTIGGSAYGTQQGGNITGAARENSVATFTQGLSLAAGTHTIVVTADGAGPGVFSPMDDFTINGSVNPVPEPSSTALLGLGGLALILRRRK